MKMCRNCSQSNPLVDGLMLAWTIFSFLLLIGLVSIAAMLLLQ